MKGLSMLLYAAVSGTSNSTAQIVTAVATIFTALGGVILALSVFLPVLRTSRETKVKIEEIGKVAEATHVIVNQQKTDSERFNIALTQHNKALGLLLDNAGIPHPELPIDQSKPVPGEPDAKPGQAPL